MANTKKITGVYTWLVIWKTQKTLESRAFGHIDSLGLCISDFAVLEVLLHKGDLPVNTIGKKVLLTSGSITSAIDRCQKRGFVKRMNDPDDRRVKVVRLTPRGRKFIKEAFADHKRVMEKVMSPLSQSERTTLTKLLRKLGKSINKQLEE